jgi:hypothetical protein
MSAVINAGRMSTMGLLSFLDRSDPSDAWPDYVHGDVTLDIPQRMLNEIRLGAPAAELQRIGKPANRRPFKAKQFDYPIGGFSFDINADAVTYFALVPLPTPEDTVGGCAFTMICPNGTAVEVRPGRCLPRSVNTCHTRRIPIVMKRRRSTPSPSKRSRWRLNAARTMKSAA